MAATQPIGRQYGTSRLPDDLRPMESLDHDLAAGQPDPRGYDLWTQDNHKIGTIRTLLGSPSTDKAYFSLVESGHMFNKKQYLIPLELISVDVADQRAFAPFAEAEFTRAPEYRADTRDFQSYYSYWRPATAAAASTTATTAVPPGTTAPGPGVRATGAANEVLRVPVTEEQVQIHKEQHEIGHVLLHKRVETETQHISEPVSRTRVEVERHAVPADQQRNYPAGAATLKDGEEIRIPVTEEQLVVEKVPRVTEEVIIRKQTDTRQAEQDVQLRREEVEVDEEGDVDLDHAAPTTQRRAD